MPWKLKKKGSQVCVVKADTGEEVHCHGTRGQAMAQMRALYASESKKPSEKALESIKEFWRDEGLSMDDMVKEMNDLSLFDNDTFKELKDSKKGWYATGETNAYGYPKEEYVPDGIVTFDDLDKYEADKEMSEQACETVGKFKAMIDNIFSPWGQVKDKVAAINKLTSDLGKRITNPPDETKEVEAPDLDFAVYKSTDGQWRWKGIYSNNQQDRDNPPDTLTDNAHKSFAYMVKEGIVPYPPLLAWHIDGLNPGQSDNVWYDEEKGNAWAEGYFHPGYETIAENLSKETDQRMSHRMPIALINKDANGHITNYISTEFSYLPPWAAANEGTEFSTNKEITMKEIPEAKREVLRKQGWTDEQIQLAASTQKDIESVVEKEEVTSEPVVEAVKEEVEEVNVPEPTDTKEVDALRKEVAETLKGLIVPMQDQINNLTTLVTQQSEIIKDLKKDDDTKVKEKLEGTPLQSRISLQDMLKSMVGGDATTKLDGRTKEAQDGPRQTKQAQDIFSILQAGGNYMDALKNDTQ